MRKYLLILFLVVLSVGGLYASNGDTTWVTVTNLDSFTHYGTYDFNVGFPDGSVHYRKIYMEYSLGQYNCPSGSQYCHQWDYDVENYILSPLGDTLELARFITPYATTGTPGFGAAWHQPYIFDVTDFYPLLKDSAALRVQYSGYSWGFTFSIKFAFIEGTPDRNVVGITPLWNAGYTYGNTASPIDSSLLPITFTPTAGSQSTEMKVIITGHGYDGATGCCEFDNTGVGHNYYVMANGTQVAQTNMNVNCGVSELYPQGGTWLYGRAGNWCPGGLVSTAQYPLTGLTAGSSSTADLDFDDSYDGISSYGDYKIASEAFSYSSINKTLDAELKDIVAPTNYAWYRRENPRVSEPVITIHNAGSTAITSLLLSYGVKDSASTQYIWTGNLAPLTDTAITLPAIHALTNLSLNSATGTHTFAAQILQVNGVTDNDQSNDTLTSQFVIAPKWPYELRIKLITSSLDANGGVGGSPADASWQITDENGNVVASRTNANVTTTYYDTVKLNPSGFYALTVTTSQCYGLSWWALPGNLPGYTAGSFAVQNMLSGNAVLALNGTSNSGQYLDDFGCGFTQYFTTVGQCQVNTPVITQSGDSLSASSGASYQWYKNRNLIPGATAQTYVATPGDGNYTVQVTNNQGCSATSASVAVVNTGVLALSDFANAISIYPNPAKDMFNLIVSAELTGNTYIVYDITGRELLTGKIENEMNEISVANISSGLYLVTITDGKSSISKRLMIQK